MKLNKYGAVDIGSIQLLHKSCISDEDLTEIQDRFNQMTSYYIKWKIRQIKQMEENLDIKKFKQCHFCIADNSGDVRPFAEVYLKDGWVKYKIIDDESDLSTEQAESLTIKFIMHPTVSKEFNCMFSIYHCIHAHFHVLQHEVSFNNEHGFVCHIPDQMNHILTHVHVLDNGVVLIG